MVVQPYLNFDGRCEEAVEFYKSAVNAEVLMMMRHNQSPEPPPPGMVPPGSENKIMHEALKIGNSMVMGSDGACSGNPVFKGITLSLTADNDADAKRFFDGLSQGGKVHQPLMKTFFASQFGILADRFGVHWMVLVTPQQ